jgi:general secretion pathway protein L
MAETPTTLRVYIDEPPDAEREAAWALFDAAGRVTRSGRGRPAAWPAATRREAVIAARHGRLVTLAIPPLPPARIEAAARFALEEQLVDAPEDNHIAIAAQPGGGKLRTAIVARAWMDAFVSASQRCAIAWNRVVLESDLAPAPPRSWRWCASSVAQPGFVRTDRGASLAVGAAEGDAPPAELLLALSRGGTDAPRTVRVDAEGITPALLARARALTGAEFVGGAPWRWPEATAATFSGAIDLLRVGPGAPARRQAFDFGWLRPALWVAAVAIGIHVAATVGNWLWLRWEAASIEREIAALARAAVPEFAQATAAGGSAAAALLRRERDLRHRAGLAAPDDFLPLLARAAPALSSLPPGALRSLSYADGRLLLDLQKIDSAQATRLQRELQSAGLVAIAAPTASGARMQVGLG